MERVGEIEEVVRDMRGVAAPAQLGQPAVARCAGSGAFIRLIVLLALVAPIASAQTSPADEPATRPIATRPTSLPTSAPVALARLSEETKSAAEESRAIDAVVATAKAIEQDPAIGRLIADVDVRSLETENVLSAKPSLEVVRELRRTWQQFQETADAQAKRVGEATLSLDAAASRLATVQTAIVATWKEVEASGIAAQTLIDRLGGLWAQTETIRGEIESTRARLFDLQDRLAATVDRLGTMGERLIEAQNSARGQLLERDSAPAWKPNGDRPASGAQQAITRQIGALNTYLHRRWPRTVLHGLIIALAAAMLYWVRRRTRALGAADPQISHGFDVFERPLSGAVLCSILLTRAIYPEAPRLALAILGAAALVPTYLILRRLLDKPLRPVLGAVLACYLLDQLRAVLASQPTAARWVLIVETAAVAGLAAWAVVGGRLAAFLSHGGGWVSWLVRGLARLAGAAMIFACGAAVIGYVRLGNLIADATLASLYIGLIFYAVVRIVDGLLLAGLRLPPLNWLATVRKHPHLLYTRLRRITRWAALLLWAWLTLKRFELDAIVYDTAYRTVTSPLLPGVSLTLGNLILFAVTLYGAILLSRFLRFVLKEDVYPRFGLARGLPYAISTMIHYIVLVIGFLMAVDKLGYDLTKLTILAGAIGVGLGFGLQNIINNFVSGLILLFERPIKVGDVIQMGDTAGTVARIGIRASYVRTSGGADIIVPNGMLIAGQVTNWTFSSRQRGMTMSVTVDGAADPRRVIGLLEQTAGADTKVDKTPKPRALLTTFTAASSTFELQLWTAEYEDWIAVRSEVAIAISEMLRRENIALK